MPDASPPTFLDETAVARPERAALAYDLDVETVVIGGGYAGLWTALSLAARGKSVAAIEAGRLGEGASGRNAGFVSPGYATSVETLLGRVGEDHARALWALSVEGVARVRGLIARTAMPGVAPVPGKLTLWRHGDGSAALRRAERLEAWGTPAQAWTGERLGVALTSPRYVAGLHQPDAFHAHPRNLLLGLAAAAETAGARLFERTPATAVDLGGLRKAVTTPRGRLRAQDVVFCGSAALREHLSGLGRFVLPVRTHMAATVPLGETLSAAIRYAGGIADTRRGGDYFRVAGDRLLWGSGITTLSPSPERLAPRIALRIAEAFPALGKVEIAQVWGGTMGYAAHRMPIVGRLGPGVWIATAFGGHGLAATAMAGDLVATGVTDNDDRWRLFVPFGLVSAAGPFGRLATEAVFRAQGWRERIREARTATPAARA